MIIIRHAGNVASCYAYNSELLVRVNQKVTRGQVIARSGDAGPGDTPHLHFQVRENREAVDPLRLLP